MVYTITGPSCNYTISLFICYIVCGNIESIMAAIMVVYVFNIIMIRTEWFVLLHQAYIRQSACHRSTSQLQWSDIMSRSQYQESMFKLSVELTDVVSVSVAGVKGALTIVDCPARRGRKRQRVVNIIGCYYNSCACVFFWNLRIGVYIIFIIYIVFFTKTLTVF